MSAGDIKQGEQVDDFIPAEARPVCPKCFKPCHPLQNYCENCDSNQVINPLAAYMPLERIRFVCGFFGDMWRLVLYGKEASILKRILCFFLVIAFAPTLIIVGLPFFLIDKIENPNHQRTVETLFYILLATTLIIYLVLNFLSI